jgi:hypothetical protein
MKNEKLRTGLEWLLVSDSPASERQRLIRTQIQRNDESI